MVHQQYKTMVTVMVVITVVTLCVLGYYCMQNGGCI